ncbi:MAG: sensor histidine kinase [Alphaproteobacteria bacterium]|nr:sensor histidine kinase [Alphaproteobacteria bacterium]
MNTAPHASLTPSLWSRLSLRARIVLLLAAAALPPAAFAVRAMARGEVLGTMLAVLALAVVALIGVGLETLVSRPLRGFARSIGECRTTGLWPATPSADDPPEIAALRREFAALVDSLAARQLRLEQLVEQRGLLIREIHHRIRNNLQVVTSLLMLQASRIASPEGRAQFLEATNRIRAISVMHHYIYDQPEAAEIDLQRFALGLCDHLWNVYGGVLGDRVALRCDCPKLRLSSDQSITLGLIVAEAVTNALRHGFPDGRSGRIDVTIKAEGERARLIVRDDGVGSGANLGAAVSGGLGRQLIEGFARQLSGTLTIDCDPGTTITIDFPIPQQAA